MTRFKQLIICVLFFSSACPIHADEAFSNLGPDDSWDNSIWVLGNVSDRPNLHLAYKFTSSVDGVFESIEVPIKLHIDFLYYDEIEFNLWSDEDGRPAEVLWSGYYWPFDQQPHLVTIEGTNLPKLKADSDYWISAKSRYGFDGYGWFRNNQNDVREFLFDNNGGTDWEVADSDIYAAFRVNVAAIPEPRTGLLFFGFGGVLMRRQEKNN